MAGMSGHQSHDQSHNQSPCCFRVCVMSQLWLRLPIQSAGRARSQLGWTGKLQRLAHQRLGVDSHRSSSQGLQPYRALVTQAALLEGGSSTASTKVAVVAFGGNALLSRGEPLTMDAQWQNATKAAKSVARLVEEEGMTVCVTHGNGPQVGLLAVQDPATGLDVLDAESEGQIGYILETQLANTLPGLEVVTLLTQTVVDPADPAFKHPTKPIGATYDKQEAERLAREKGWAIAADGDKWRRVVASPDPQAVVEARAIQLLLANNVVPICCGGGGIPVAVDKERHRRYGVEAVVDKDLASAVLAIKIKADWLLMLTDCDCIFDPEQWPDRKVPLPSPITPEQLRAHAFAAGSMAPKVEAACRFVAATGGRAGVGRLEDAAAILQGSKGTVVASAGSAPEG